MTTEHLASALESLLFVSAEPAPLERLRAALDCSRSELDQAVEELAGQLRERGVRLQRSDEGLQLVTAPEHAARVETYLGIAAAARPSAAALETLAIVAYRQPISRPALEEARGVNCERAVRSLVAAGLIQEAGRGPGLGRPVLYVTTTEFLQRFGLESLADLPPLDQEEPAPVSSMVEGENPRQTTP